MTKDERDAFEQLSIPDQKRLLRVAQKIHQNTGHRNVEELARRLREKNAPLESRAAMEKIDCDVCKETANPVSKPVATMETDRVPWRTIGMDIKEGRHGGKRYKYLIVCCEACKFARAI